MLVNVLAAFSVPPKAPDRCFMMEQECHPCMVDSNWLMLLVTFSIAADGPSVDWYFWRRATSTDQ